MNKHLWNFICLIFLWSLASSAYASVSAETNRKVIALGETVNLTIRIKDENTNAKPDLDALNTHFNVINSSEQTQIQILNGKASSLKQWTITLEPKQTGPVTIPAIQVGDAYTEPLNIEITAASELDRPGRIKGNFYLYFY